MNGSANNTNGSATKMNGNSHKDKNSPAIVVSVGDDDVFVSFEPKIILTFFLFQIPDDFDGHPLESLCIAPNLTKYLQYVLIPGGFVQDR